MSEVPLTPAPPELDPSERVRRFLLGAPRSLADRGLFHQLSLVPFLAWVGLGADGLSSSSYGPDEAFRTLGDHTYLALAVAALMALHGRSSSRPPTAASSRSFPHGGGGYVVATKLLGAAGRAWSPGCALLVDYVLTITVSIAAAGDALFSFLPPAWHAVQAAGSRSVLIVGLTLLNIRGVRSRCWCCCRSSCVFLAHARRR